MRRLIIASIAAIIFTATVVGTAQAYDRKPAVLGGFYPDGWYYSLSDAKSFGHGKFPTAKYVYCGGVIMQGYRSQSSFVRGTTRYWDKVSCVAGLQKGWVGFVVDAKKDRATMYNVHHFAD